MSRSRSEFQEIQKTACNSIGRSNAADCDTCDHSSAESRTPTWLITHLIAESFAERPHELHLVVRVLVILSVTIEVFTTRDLFRTEAFGLMCGATLPIKLHFAWSANSPEYVSASFTHFSTISSSSDGFRFGFDPSAAEHQLRLELTPVQ
jgi:hypothetical protein